MFIKIHKTKNHTVANNTLKVEKEIYHLSNLINQKKITCY